VTRVRGYPLRMRVTTSLLGLVLLAATAAPAAAQTNLTGDWMVTTHEISGPNVLRLTLVQEGEKLSGKAGNRSIEGSVKGSAIEFKDANMTVRAALEGGEIKGEAVSPERTVKWTAVRIPPRPAQPKTHDFEPTEFHLYFSSKPKPVLRIHPGDTVRTWSVDAGGRDKAGNRRSGGGNPETGPFYVEGAVPGDTLVVRLLKVRLNRDWAGSGNRIMSNALESGTVASAKWDNQFPSRWKLDTAKGVASLEKPSEALKNFTVPLQPMLGCIGVAPPGEWSIRATDSGRFGGNMDYNQIREGTTVYLPVNHAGALLFLGDGHAAQGDGELTGDALETSMDFEFTVDVIPGRNFGHPLAENAEFLISLGIGGSLDQALQQATSGMMRWLERDYGLSANEAAMLLGFAVKYDIVDLVGTQVGIAAKLPKTTLAQLTKKAS
jgi:acetamidase/formamidase